MTTTRQHSEGAVLHTRNAKDQIALLGVRLYSRVEALAQVTTMTQRWHNRESRPVEANCGQCIHGPGAPTGGRR
jgi:hypothetical protein